MDDDCTQIDASLDLFHEPSTSVIPPVGVRFFKISRKRSLSSLSSSSSSDREDHDKSKKPRKKKVTSSPTLSPKTQGVVPNAVTDSSNVSFSTTQHTSPYDDLFHVVETTLATLADRDMDKVKSAFVAYHRSVFVQRASGIAVDFKLAKDGLLETLTTIVNAL